MAFLPARADFRREVLFHLIGKLVAVGVGARFGRRLHVFCLP